MMETMSEDRSEIAFFDVETTVPTRPGQGFALLEFGLILVCPRKLVELHNYSTLVRPTNPNLITLKSVRCNGITGEAIRDAPFFAKIADIVFDLLHGRIWAGHNIVRFDIVRIKEAFAEIGRPAPEPKGIIDSLVLLTQRFGKRAGDMKMATLATYFGIGKQTHRSLDDVRMNLEVVKYCATVLFLESSLPDIFTEKSWVSPNAITRSRRNERSSLEVNTDVPSSSSKFENISILSVEDHRSEGNHPILSLMTSSTAHEVPIQEDPFDMGALSNQMNTESLRPDVTMEEETVKGSSEMPSVASISEGSSGSTEFLEPNEVTISSICASFDPHFHGGQRMILLHKNVTLQLLCPHLKIRFGLSTKFVDHAGRPKLNFMVDAPPSLCGVLEACDGVAQKQHADSSSSSDWNRVVTRNKGYENRPVVRLHIPTAVNGDVAHYGTEMYQKEPSGTLQKLVFSKFDPADLATWFNPGTFLDAYLSLNAYDFQQKAGIKLVAKKLIIHKH